MNLTLGQKIAMALVLMNVLAGGTAQLAPLMGPAAAAAVAGIAALCGAVLAGWIFIVTGQQPMIQQVQNTQGGQQALVRTVLNMPGVENIDVNKKASPELATLAVDPELPKISATPKDLQAVAETAETAKTGA